MKRAIQLFVFVSVMALGFAGCFKSEDFVNPVYQCMCGNVSWNGQESELLLAEYVLLTDTSFLSRRYYITADLALEDEIDAHNVNMTIELDSVTQGTFFVDTNDLIIKIEEVNFNDPILPVREFQAIEGVVTVNAAILGGTETASFQLNVKELFNGQPVGFAFPVSGSLVVTIDN